VTATADRASTTTGDRTFDVVVIGAGPAGENVAGRCADGGLTVAMAEDELVGGECSYWACVPSKTLVRPGDVVAAARRVPGAREAVTGPVDGDAALARRDYMTNNWDDTSALGWVRDEGITLLRGRARIAGARVVSVEQHDGTVVTVTARRAVVVASGTTSVLPPIPGLADARPWDNRGATSAKSVPERLLVLGGGAVGVEMAQAFRRLGAREVTVVEGGARLLAREEPFAGEEVAAAFATEGIIVVTGHAMTSVSRAMTDAPVVATLDDGRELVADEILVAVGRRPATTDIGVDRVGLTPGRYIDVDDHLRARGVDGDWLYAVGDCNGRAGLTHMGKYQARIAADVILGKDARDMASARAVPRVTFTDPQVCAVGLTEAQAREQGFDVRVVRYPTGDVPGAYTSGEGVSGTSQLVVDEARRVVVGATFTGPGLQDLLHSATIAVACEVPLEHLWHAVPSFPTLSEVWLHLLEAYGL
jgi:dihydrolipoamide dehydrogenase